MHIARNSPAQRTGEDNVDFLALRALLYLRLHKRWGPEHEVEKMHFDSVSVSFRDRSLVWHILRRTPSQKKGRPHMSKRQISQDLVGHPVLLDHVLEENGSRLPQLNVKLLISHKGQQEDGKTGTTLHRMQ